jgi:hypothetical protein
MRGYSARSVVVVVAEEAAHVDVLLWLLLDLLLNDLGGGSSGSSSDGGTGSGGRLESGELLEVVSSGNSGLSNVLEGVDDEVGHGRGSGVSHGDGKAGKVAGGSSEGLEHILSGDGEDLGVVELAVVEHVLDVHLELEGVDLELVEKSGLGGGNLLVGLNEGNVGNNLNLGLDNLGGNGKGLEERGLLGVHTGGTGGHNNLLGGDSTDSGGGGSDLGVKDVLDLVEVTVGEDHTDVKAHLVADDTQPGAGLVLLHAGLVVLITLLRGGHELVDAGLHVSVLAHDHLGVNLSQLPSHDGNLLGGNVIDLNEEDLVVLAEGVLELLPSGGLGLSLGSLLSGWHFYLLIY